MGKMDWDEDNEDPWPEPQSQPPVPTAFETEQPPVVLRTEDHLQEFLYLGRLAKPSSVVRAKVRNFAALQPFLRPLSTMHPPGHMNAAHWETWRGHRLRSVGSETFTATPSIRSVRLPELGRQRERLANLLAWS